MVEATQTPPVPEGQPRRRLLGGTRDSLTAVFGNPGLRRVQLALAGSMIGDWAYATAVAVWAYGVGGTTAVGVWGAVRLTLMAVTAPVGAVLADRFPRRLVMVMSDLCRVVLVSSSAVLLYVDAPAAPVFVLASLAALLGAPFRSAQRALMPQLAERPEELTASNGVTSTFESLAFFVGPALGAALVVLTDVAAVFLFNALTFLLSLVLVLGVRVAAPAEEAVTEAATEVPEEPSRGALAEMLAGFRAILADRDLTITTIEVCAQTVVAGASVVFTVVVAVEVLGTGAAGVGYLESALGVGAVVGGIVAISRSGRQRLGQDLTFGVVLWSAPLLLLAIAPVPLVALLTMALLGFGNPLVDVNLDTIVQRLTPDAVMARVFGALEGCLIATMALGALLMPLLVHLVGLRSSLAIVGALVSIIALAGLPRMLRLDVRLGVPAEVELLGRVSIFAPLSPTVREALGRALIRVEVPAGGVIVREGEESDRFYVIESGAVEVTQAGRLLRRELPGDFFGEIGLLRSVPRTATVTALRDTVLQALPRQEFLDAVTGVSESRLAVEDIVTRRLTV